MANRAKITMVWMMRPFLYLDYSFSQAIEDKWLTDYQVLIVGVDEPTIQSYIETREIVGFTEAGIVSDAETLAAKLSLLKATAEYDLKRVISFHGRVNRQRNFHLNTVI